MAVTPLTVYGWSSGSGNLPNAGGLTPTPGGGTVFVYPTSLVGQALGWGQVCGQNQNGAWPALNAPDDPNGSGFVFDNVFPASLLDLQEIVAGTWQAELSLATVQAATTLTADVLTRVFIWRANTSLFEPVGLLTLPGQTITASSTAFMLSSALLPLQFGVGDRLYVDVWLNITANPNINSGLQVNIALSQNNSTGNLSTSWATPGYQPLTMAQLAGAYAYGGFQLNDGAAYSVQSKDFTFPDIKPALYKIARLEGMKKTGETVDELRIPVTIQVIGTSRADLEMKVDALFGALAYRQQMLTLHSADARYWIADAIAGKVSFVPGRVIAVAVPVTFLVESPYALAAVTSSFASGTQTMIASGGVATYPQKLTGGGTIFCRPTLVITNLTAGDNCTLNTALVNGTPTTSIQVASLAAALTANDTLLLSSGGHTQSVVASAPAAASGSPVTISVTSFTPNFSYPIGATVTKQAMLTQVVISQTFDGQTLTVSNLSLDSTHFLTIVGDPTAANGSTVIQDNNGVPLAFSGVFPVMQPFSTFWNVTVSCASNPSIGVSWQWTARFVA